MDPKSKTPQTATPAKKYGREINVNLDADLALAKAGDMAAIHRITLDNMPLVISICKRMRLSMEFEDLIQEAALHMPKIIRNFDPARGFQFSTYATTALYRRLKRVSMEKQTIRVPVASYDNQLRRTRFRTLNGSDFSRIEADSADNPVEETEFTIHLRRAMQKLNPRLRLVLHLRFYENLKLRQVGEQVGVTRERARQLILEGLSELREIMNCPSVS